MAKLLTRLVTAIAIVVAALSVSSAQTAPTDCELRVADVLAICDIDAPPSIRLDCFDKLVSVYLPK